MSLDRCKTCERIVDTDAFPEFYDFSYLVNDMGGYCESCRDDIYDTFTPEQIANHERKIYG